MSRGVRGWDDTGLWRRLTLALGSLVAFLFGGVFFVILFFLSFDLFSALILREEVDAWYVPIAVVSGVGIGLSVWLALILPAIANRGLPAAIHLDSETLLRLKNLQRSSTNLPNSSN